MEKFLISGIQQVGIGCENFAESWQWYIDMFGVDIRILEDDTVAERMLPYTGGVPQKRHACVAVSLLGGGGMEVWQYSERKPSPVPFDIAIGDLGIFAAKIKCTDVKAFHEEICAKYNKVSALSCTPDGTPCFYVCDPWKNWFQIIENKTVFIRQKRLTGGTFGALVGVTDIERSLSLYRDVLGYDEIVYDRTDSFEDWKALSGGAEKYRRMLLRHSKPRTGAFAELFGPSEIELVTALDRSPRKIFEGRFWGDPGFIQICFDVANMDEFGKFTASKGFPFTVDSCPDGERFDMGDASGRFTYVEDPDGTLIEFVETEKVPIIKALGIGIDMVRRDRSKPLPKALLRLFSVLRVKTVK